MHEGAQGVALDMQLASYLLDVPVNAVVQHGTDGETNTAEALRAGMELMGLEGQGAPMLVLCDGQVFSVYLSRGNGTRYLAPE